MSQDEVSLNGCFDILDNKIHEIDSPSIIANQFYKEVFGFVLNIIKRKKENGAEKVNPTDACLEMMKLIFANEQINNYKSAVIKLLAEDSDLGLKIGNFETIFNIFNDIVPTSNTPYSFKIPLSNKGLFDNLYNHLYQNQLFIIRETQYLFSPFNIDFLGLSSGEKSVISIFSRLQDLLTKLKKVSANLQFNVSGKSFLLLLDEPEIGLHPQWQKEYIQNLLCFIKKLYPESWVQLILTTHSPIMLSDMPSHHIVYLAKNETTGFSEIKYNGNNEETFAANIYDLFKDAFFLNKGTMGAFAQNYIDKLIEEIDEINTDLSKETVDIFKKKIELIGEKLIRYSLEDFLIEKSGNKLTEIQVLEHRLEVLKLQNNETNKN